MTSDTAKRPSIVRRFLSEFIRVAATFSLIFVLLDGIGINTVSRDARTRMVFILASALLITPLNLFLNTTAQRLSEKPKV